MGNGYNRLPHIGDNFAYNYKVKVKFVKKFVDFSDKECFYT